MIDRGALRVDVQRVLLAYARRRRALRVDKLFVVHAGKERWPVADRIEAIPVTAITSL